MCTCMLLLSLVVLPALAGPRGATISTGPAFAAQQQSAILARVGESASIRCRVLRLADRAVSWVRSSDLQILTHAGAVFTADSRVSCFEAPAGPALDEDSADFGDILTSRDDSSHAGSVHTLHIERLRVSDSGRYECQINTEPKLSSFFNLTVVESSLPVVSVRATGTQGGEVWSARGGAARLACEARYEPATGAPALSPDVVAALPSLRVRWTHDGETLDPQSPRGGISLDTERWPGRVVSRVTLAALGVRDAGRYSCTAAERSATLTLRLRGTDESDYEVIEGEMEPMQRDQAVARVSAGARHTNTMLLLLLPVLLFLT